MNEVILGIETSCDDTAVALVTENGEVLSSVVSSQIDIHNEFGGIYPEYAARAHVNAILPTIDLAFRRASLTPKDIKAIGVTRGPGLIGSLLVGLTTAGGLGLGWGKPVIGVNHLRGHLRSADLEHSRVEYPAVVLLVSGGHTILSYMYNSVDIKILSSTKDDSVGESYDKVGRMLGLGYPGGPVVDKLAKQGQKTIDFPRPMIHKGLEFSFSGLKSAVARFLESSPEYPKEDIAASFVDAVLDVLITKSKRALKMYRPKSFVIVGGVAASPQIREAAQELCESQKVSLCLPPLKWATDNGAMIALTTWDYVKQGVYKPPVHQLKLPINEF